MASSTKQLIERFLSSKRIAAIGVSRDPKDFTRAVVSEFQTQGYDIVTVNPKAEANGAVTVFRRIQEVSPSVEAALIMTPSSVTESVVRDCKEAGIGFVWMYRAVGKGAVSEAAVEFCHQNGIDVIAGHCPLMFLPGAAAIHRFHGFLLKVIGKYPK
jgi:hypothetical protein